MSLDDKTATVIGASSGVGRAVVQSLLAANARVTAVARGAEGLAALRSEFGERLATLQADATEAGMALRLLGDRRGAWVPADEPRRRSA